MAAVCTRINVIRTHIDSTHNTKQQHYSIITHM